ncbi:MAG TPA: hypothetical protein VEZ20_16140 [Allosphingosinicella sp.]|jgi:hypothetical protein|nr:hypothetical protein [Allosphingosinicella sp.]
MTTLLWANILPILASLLIGLAAARWTFRRAAAAPTKNPGTDAQ